MAKKPTYPLAQVLQVKQRRVDQAEKVVKERQAALEKEQQTLRKLEEERDKVQQHRDDKLAQLRLALDTGTTAPKIKQMKNYLEVVAERLAGEEKKVTEQTDQVRQAERNLQEAKDILRKRRKEVEKIEIHEKEWWKKTRKEERIEEGKRESELGSTMFVSRKYQRRGKK